MRAASSKAGARIGPYTVLGKNCQVDEDANVSGAIVWADTRIGREADVTRRHHRPIGTTSAATPRCSGGVLGDTTSHRRIQPPMNPDIFKAYDVRGLYPAELDEQRFHQIGRAFVAFLKAKRIGVGRDMRLSSPSLAAAFIAGAREQGADVVDYGMIATDMIYYAVGDRRPRRRRADYRVAQSEAVQRLQDGRARQPSAQRRQRHLGYPRHDRRQPDSRRRPRRPAA